MHVPRLCQRCFTKSEIKIFNLLVSGKIEIKDLQQELNLSRSGVQCHRHNILAKFGVDSTAAMLAYVLANCSRNKFIHCVVQTTARDRHRKLNPNWIRQKRRAYNREAMRRFRAKHRERLLAQQRERQHNWTQEQKDAKNERRRKSLRKKLGLNYNAILPKGRRSKSFQQFLDAKKKSDGNDGR